MGPSDWVFLVLPVPQKLFLCFSGLLFRDNFEPIQWFFRFPPTTLELKLYPKSSVGSGFSFFFLEVGRLENARCTLVKSYLESEVFLSLFLF